MRKKIFPAFTCAIIGIMVIYILMLYLTSLVDHNRLTLGFIDIFKGS